MEFVGSFSGGPPVLKKFQIGEAMATNGVPVVVGGAGNEGVALAATTTASDLVGVTAKIQATLLTAQQTDNSDPARLVTVVVNPDAMYRARLSGGATSGTDLTALTVTTASTDGLTVSVSGTDFSSPTQDEGTVYCITGANAGVSRKITSVADGAATVTLAFPNDIAVGDTFFTVPFAPGEDQFVQLTTTLDELDASVAVDTDNNNFRVIELDLNGVGDSYATVVPFDCIWAAGGSI